MLTIAKSMIPMMKKWLLLLSRRKALRAQLHRNWKQEYTQYVVRSEVMSYWIAAIIAFAYHVSRPKKLMSMPRKSNLTWEDVMLSQYSNTLYVTPSLSRTCIWNAFSPIDCHQLIFTIVAYWHFFSNKTICSSFHQNNHTIWQFIFNKQNHIFLSSEIWVCVQYYRRFLRNFFIYTGVHWRSYDQKCSDFLTVGKRSKNRHISDFYGDFLTGDFLSTLTWS